MEIKIKKNTKINCSTKKETFLGSQNFRLTQEGNKNSKR